MDAYGLFCQQDAADERAENALARYEAEFANEGVDTLAVLSGYEVRSVGASDVTGEVAA